MPNLCPLLCWNHIHQDIKNWVHNCNGTSDDVSVYTNNVMQLLRSATKEEFEERYQSFSSIWGKELNESMN